MKHTHIHFKKKQKSINWEPQTKNTTKIQTLNPQLYPRPKTTHEAKTITQQIHTT